MRHLCHGSVTLYKDCFNRPLYTTPACIYVQNAPSFIKKLISELMNIHEYQGIYFMNIYD